jgi:hypothetical protein
MTGSRCPACGAATPEAVSWCTLCFADLRPAPAAPETERPADVVPQTPATSVPEVPAPTAAIDPLTAPISVLLGAPVGGSGVVAPEAHATEIPTLPGVVALEDPLVSLATWPCTRCGSDVPLDLDLCPSCGAGFLSGTHARPATTLPLVGDVAAMTPGKRYGLAAVVAAVFAVGLVLLATIGGAVL